MLKSHCVVALELWFYIGFIILKLAMLMLSMPIVNMTRLWTLLPRMLRLRML